MLQGGHLEGQASSISNSWLAPFPRLFVIRPCHVRAGAACALVASWFFFFFLTKERGGVSKTTHQLCLSQFTPNT